MYLEFFQNVCSYSQNLQDSEYLNHRSTIQEDHIYWVDLVIIPIFEE